MHVLNTTKNTLLADNAVIAKSFVKRLCGLMGTKSLAKGACLILQPCTSVHTCFMRYGIDVVFVKGRAVVGIEKSMQPWRVSRIYFGATYALELPSGTAAVTHTEIGDEINFSAAAPA